jgi:translation initiation factor eIF-2B subunit epsilon
MRDLDKRQIMTGDFIVVYGDIVSNFPMDTALAAHRARRAKDKNAIMTMVLRAAGAAHRTKAQGNSPVFIVDPSKDRCLHYEQMNPTQPRHCVELDAELLSSCDELDIRHDLIDCGIDICTPDVLALWSDNFDYEVPRRGFLHSVLKDYELNGKTIHTHIIEEGHYAARVRNLHSYDSVSKDILSRWTFPMTPDSNIMAEGTYSYAKGNVYVEEEVDVALSARIGPRTQIGRGTCIGEKSNISKSVIGRDCIIGNDCVIEDSYIWDRAILGNGCIVRKAIVASDGVVGNNCTIEDGALLSYRIKLGDGKTIKRRQRMTKSRQSRKSVPAVSVTNTDGEAQEYMPSDDEDVDVKAGLGGFYLNPSASLSADSISTLHSDVSDLSESELPTQPQHIRTRSGGSFLSQASDETHTAASSSDKAFQQDASSSIYDALREGTDVSTIQLELQALRMSVDANPHQIRQAIVTGLVRYCIESRRGSDGRTVKDILTANKMLVERSIHDKESTDDTKPDQVDLLLLIQKDLAARLGKGAEVEKGAEQLMVALCNDMYLQDVLEQEGLEQWWEDKRSQEVESMKAIRSQMEKFMEVVMAEEESGSEEEEDSEEEESDNE